MEEEPCALKLPLTGLTHGWNWGILVTLHATTTRIAQIRYDPPAFAIMELTHNLRSAMVHAVEDLARRHDLTERRLWILDAVYRGIDRPLRLAQLFDVLPSTITSETARLSRDGLLVRESLSGGGRSVKLRLTAAGEALQQELIGSLNALMAPSVASLSAEEQESFLAIGRKLVDNLAGHKVLPLSQGG